MAIVKASEVSIQFKISSVFYTLNAQKMPLFPFLKIIWNLHQKQTTGIKNTYRIELAERFKAPELLKRLITIMFSNCKPYNLREQT